MLEIHLSGQYTGSAALIASDFLVSLTGGGTGAPPNTVAPAGIAGEPINLGLTSPSTDDMAKVDVVISDVPSEWTVNGGTRVDDHSWTVETSDVRAVSVTAPAGFSGAALLTVAETWTDAAGNGSDMELHSNVEAYAPGSPIYAWSGDDFLTVSSAHDLFVFSQPIGSDTIYSFDPAADQIDLVGYAGFSSFSDVQVHLTEDDAGNARITLADGQSITLSGVDAASLTAANVVFDQTPVLANTATMMIGEWRRVADQRQCQ